jgi:carboxypeptidase Q
MVMSRTQRVGLVLTAAAVALVATLPLRASETIDYDGINKIKQQGLNAATSQVMDVSSYLTDVYGPRLTGSPNVEKAGEWAVAKMKEWGLANVALEPWPADASGSNNGFPRGWSNDKFYMAAVSPQAFPITGTPTAWTPGTAGLVRGEVALVNETTLEELNANHPAGSLKGKWIMRAAVPDVAAYWNPLATRYTPDELQKLESPAHPIELGVTPPGGRQAGGGRGGAPAAPATGTPCQGRGGGANACDDFFKAEAIAGTLSTAPRGHGIYTIGGASRTADPVTMYPQVAIGAEQYGRMARLLAKNMPVTIEADIKNTYYPNPRMFNVVAEIPGTDKADELVMLGAHFDSWHASTGATDNGAGSAAMMEAMRILKQSGVKLRRTVRIGLWTGEEQGLIGSARYVAAHFGSPAPRGGGAGARAGGGGAPAALGAAAAPAAPTLLPDHAKFAGYFNIDNGTGAIRGVYLQGNQAVASIFRDWMEPFHTIGMTTLTVDNTGGTDHQSFDAVNLPGFQFIQDEIEYGTVTHHTNMDSYERLQPEDMRRNATIAATFAFLAANRDDKLPRKPPTSPFVGGRRGGGN